MDSPQVIRVKLETVLRVPASGCWNFGHQHPGSGSEELDPNPHLKVHKNENFFAPILNFVLLHC
jgi:hypothetical protein